jgi:hypothetical protein
VALTEAQSAGVKAEFARRKKMTLVGLLMIGLPLYGVVRGIGGTPVLGMGTTGWWIVWAAVATGVSLWFLRLWRCPACGAPLGQPPSTTTCRKCGAAFQ